MLDRFGFFESLAQRLLHVREQDQSLGVGCFEALFQAAGSFINLLNRLGAFLGMNGDAFDRVFHFMRGSIHFLRGGRRFFHACGQLLRGGGNVFDFPAQLVHAGLGIAERLLEAASLLDHACDQSAEFLPCSRFRCDDGGKFIFFIQIGTKAVVVFQIKLRRLADQAESGLSAPVNVADDPGAQQKGEQQSASCQQQGLLFRVRHIRFVPCDNILAVNIQNLFHLIDRVARQVKSALISG
ncbi:hypothetical protein D3C71_1344790 [compost metagenome]